MSATPAAQPADGGVDVDPIRCWWKTSAGAVRVGEQFTLTLTCAVLESADVQVVPDQAPLAPATIQLAPFDVVSGTHPADQRAGLRRFFQYMYVLRAIDPDVIGKDVPLPPLSLHYRVTSRVSGNASLEGRDHSYVLPSQSIRVLSVVPVEATDIRDGADAGFDTIGRLGFRANVLSIVSLTLAGLALVTFGATLARAARQARRGTAAVPTTIAPASMRRHVSAELAAVARAGRAQGWSEPLVERALAAVRIAAALALGRAIAQQPVAAGSAASAGRLVVAPRLGRRSPIAISSAVTAEDVTRRLDGAGVIAHADRAALDDLRHALSVLSAALYAEDASVARDGLDEAVARAEAAANQLTTGGVVARLRGWWPLGADARLG